MEVVMTVFKSFETGLREATIYPRDLLSAMKMLGLNPMEQDIMDLCNTVPKNGLIFFPDFCQIVLRRWREADEEVFRQGMFKVRNIIYNIIIYKSNIIESRIKI